MHKTKILRLNILRKKSSKSKKKSKSKSNSNTLELVGIKFNDWGKKENAGITWNDETQIPNFNAFSKNLQLINKYNGKNETIITNITEFVKFIIELYTFIEQTLPKDAQKLGKELTIQYNILKRISKQPLRKFPGISKHRLLMVLYINAYILMRLYIYEYPKSKTTIEIRQCISKIMNRIKLYNLDTLNEGVGYLALNG